MASEVIGMQMGMASHDATSNYIVMNHYKDL